MRPGSCAPRDVQRRGARASRDYHGITAFGQPCLRCAWPAIPLRCSEANRRIQRHPSSQPASSCDVRREIAPPCADRQRTARPAGVARARRGGARPRGDCARDRRRGSRRRQPARERPDVALVGLGLSSQHALDLIGEIVRESACPVIALLSARRIRLRPRSCEARHLRVHPERRPAGARKRHRHHAAALRRIQSLQGPFGRRAVIEQAKGVSWPVRA